MDASGLQQRYDFAMTLVEEAAALALDYFRNLGALTVRRKGRQDVVSEADLNTELLIQRRLKERFPEDGFLGEETGRDELSSSSCLWVVDPIDGTQPFVSGMGSWCVSIALLVDGVLEMGFVNCPVRRELFAGRRGGPATLNGEPIRVRDEARIDDGVVGLGYSPRIRPEQFLEPASRLIARGGTFYREGSGALSLCYVACGRLIGYLEAHINSWDCLGALAVIEAAGGLRSDFLANDGLWKGNWLVTGPAALYPELLAIFEGSA